MVRVDLNDPHTLLPALQGAYGLFSVQNFWEVGVDAEVLQGKNLADAAEAAHVKHLVYSSVGGAERGTGLRAVREQVGDRTAYPHAGSAPHRAPAGVLHG